MVKTVPSGRVFWLVLSCMGMSTACGAREVTPTAVPPVSDAVSALALAQAREVRARDSLEVLYAAEEARAVTRAGIPSDATGLIGRNRGWGEMYAARFQMGAGQALRVSVSPATLSQRDAQSAFAGVEAGVQSMAPSGALSARVPLSLSMGSEPAPVDVASGAAFYLGDACMALLALEVTPTRDAIASEERRTALRSRVVHAVRWLVTQSPLLLAGDQHAPNRLLFDARAYLACGLLANDSMVTAAARPFVAAWHPTLTPGGWFLEGDGWDTSYQAVSLEVGIDVASLLPPGSERMAVQRDVQRGAAWLATRVLPDGRINSAGNTRTCGGGESFLGSAKSLDLPSVVLGLTRAAVHSGATVDPVLLGTARQVFLWATQHPNGDPCADL